jgi:hypothetical protein
VGGDDGRRPDRALAGGGGVGKGSVPSRAARRPLPVATPAVALGQRSSGNGVAASGRYRSPGGATREGAGPSPTPNVVGNRRRSVGR